jgi:hypothetical protein
MAKRAVQVSYDFGDLPRRYVQKGAINVDRNKSDLRQLSKDFQAVRTVR